MSILLLLLTLTSVSTNRCPIESARNIPSGSITVYSNNGWVIGGWGFASPFNVRNYGNQQFNWGSGNFGSGNFGSNNQGNSNYGSGNLGNRNLGSYNVGNDNCGSYNTGNLNIGSWNVGTGNNGSYNLGLGNIGNGNTGSLNNGQINVGVLNIGTNNLGITNNGQNNFGVSNIGGNGNVGVSNFGYDNVGVSNLGYLNVGTNNTGAWNTGEGNVGYLASVQSVNIAAASGGAINWKDVTIVANDTLTATGNTGWVNLNDTNVGIGQSGTRNVGYSNEGNSNTGYNNSGNENTGYNLEGDGLIGNGLSAPTSPVTISGISSEDLLLDSSIYGYIQDSIMATYPQTLAAAQAQAEAQISAFMSTFNMGTCSSFSPVPIANSFSINIRCTGSIKITDLYCSGDSFNVYKNGVLWLTTPVLPVSRDPNCLNMQMEPEDAFYDPEFSHVLGWVASGSYQITVVPTVTRWGGGAVAIKVDDFCDRTFTGNYIRF